MYFPSPEETRFIQQGLLPEARRQPVADELRGWCWAQPPLRPIYGRPIAMYEAAGKYCPTGRDVYLRRVERAGAAPTPPMRAGQALHRLAADLVTETKRLIYLYGTGCAAHLERLLDRPLPAVDGPESDPGPGDRLIADLAAVRRFEARRLIERVEAVLAAQPYVGADSLAALAVPVCVETKLDGRFLGLSERLSLDALGLRGNVVIDLKFGPREEFHRLATTGYAMVLESLYDAPIDLGCVVYVRVDDGRVTVTRDFHVICDELRQMFVEQRDERMRTVAEEIDPGLPAACPPTCGYLNRCRDPQAGLLGLAAGQRAANLVPTGTEAVARLG